MVRAELGPQVVPAMVGHVGLQMGAKWGEFDDLAYDRALKEARLVVLAASKRQMLELEAQLRQHAPWVMDMCFTSFVETEGPLADVTVASGLLLGAKEREILRPITLLGALKPWRMK